MSGGLIVVASVIGAVALLETGLPLTFKALRLLWRMAMEYRLKAKGEGVPSAEVDAVEAQGTPHRALPDSMMDGESLAKVYDEVRLGHSEAMVKLGDYAFRLGEMVEAYYWTALAELKGVADLEETLEKIETEWMKAGCPPQYGDIHDEFTEVQGSFARALLHIRCAVDTSHARVRMSELAEQGCAEAQLLLKKRPLS